MEIDSMEMKSKTLPLILLAALFTQSSQAKVYKWLDESGKVVYSQTPRPDAREIQLPDVKSTVTRTPSANAQHAPTARQVPVSSRTARQGIRSGSYCEKAQRNIRLLQQAGPDTVFITQDRKLVKYSEDEIRQRLDRARKARAIYCGKAQAGPSATMQAGSLSAEGTVAGAGTTTLSR